MCDGDKGSEKEVKIGGGENSTSLSHVVLIH